MAHRLGVPLWQRIRTAIFIVTTASCHWHHLDNSVSAWTTTTSGDLARITKFHQEPLLSGQGRRQRQCHSTTRLYSKKTKKNDDTPQDPAARSKDSVLERIGILAQPIVGISLLSVATMGGGLPAGPLGLVGALEGLSYVVVVVLALRALVTPNPERTTSQQLSLVTLGLALVVLGLLLTTQGCIPNAKPLLDYSAYVRVCDPN
mmetsp:Transcript_80965/g.158954  ORF Transcript_80965/g.158954 Transcript_80965/m.158954 type:complete len:204 (+) Transcript_80965:607-1218(+)